MWFRGHQGDPSRVPSKGSKIDTWLGVIQSTLGSSDSSSSITKIISLMHALIPLAKANQHSMLSQNPSCYFPKQQEPSKSRAYHFQLKSQKRFSKDFLKIKKDLAEIISNHPLKPRYKGNSPLMLQVEEDTLRYTLRKNSSLTSLFKPSLSSEKSH